MSLLRSYALFVFVIPCWGANWAFMKLGLEYMSAQELVVVRLVIAAIFMFCVLLPTGILSWSHWRYRWHIIPLGLIMPSLFYWGCVEGAARLESGIAGVVAGLIPIFSLIGSALFLREERLGLMRIVGIVLGFVGTGFLSMAQNDANGLGQVTGIFLIILAGIIFSGSFVYVQRFMRALDISPLALATYQNVLGAVLFLVIFPQPNWIVLVDWHPLLVIVLGLGVMGTAVSFLVYSRIVRELGTVRSSIAVYLTPVFSLMVGIIFLDEHLDGWEILGVITIISGIILSGLKKLKET